MTPSKSVKPHTPHPTPYTLPLGKTFCRKPYLSGAARPCAGMAGLVPKFSVN
ncbi:MAG: hypothetical protein O9295_15555 [Microcystis sp. LE18-22.4A]|nr:hypothetical protein [Microcystis sp. LE18-22.4A]